MKVKPWVLFVAESADYEWEGQFNQSLDTISLTNVEWEQHSYYDTENKALEEATRQYEKRHVLGTMVKPT